MESIIPAYDMEEVEQFFSNEEEFPMYIEETVLGEGSEETKVLLVKYLEKYEGEIIPEVASIIGKLLEMETLLTKTQVVNDGSYRNCVLLICPSEWQVTKTGGLSGELTLDEYLRYFQERAEVFFINLSSEQFYEESELE